ncbi:hypothetical protein NCS55_01173000 [Fusarium keratoplasticum]|nr:hypothetical protein NCS55_01173000 [Fusarium keratoplasticum]
MTSPGDGDSQAPLAPSAGNDLGKRKRNSPPPRRSRVDSDTTTTAQQPPPEPEGPDDSDPGATPVQFDADQDD